MVDVDDVAAFEARDSRPLCIAALQDDHSVAGIVDALDDLNRLRREHLHLRRHVVPADDLASLPSRRRASAIANDEPMASPSGRACRPRRIVAGGGSLRRRERPLFQRLWWSCPSLSSVASFVAVGGALHPLRRSGVGFRPLRLFLVQIAQYLLDSILVCDRFVEAELNQARAAGAASCPPAAAGTAWRSSAAAVSRRGGVTIIV